MDIRLSIEFNHLSKSIPISNRVNHIYRGVKATPAYTLLLSRGPNFKKQQVISIDVQRIPELPDPIPYCTVLTSCHSMLTLQIQAKAEPKSISTTTTIEESIDRSISKDRHYKAAGEART